MNNLSRIPGFKLAAAAAWLAVCTLGSTYVMGQAALSASLLLGPPRTNVMQQVLHAAVVSSATLLSVLAVLVACAAATPVLRPPASRLSIVLAAMFATGLPAAMVLLALTMWTGKDLRDLSSPLGLLGFGLWMRALMHGWRGAWGLAHPRA